MTIEVFCKSDKGLRRESNQDNFLINKDLGLFVVADGMGGHSGGEVASKIAIQTVEEVFEEMKNTGISARDLVLRAYTEACRRIYDVAAKDSKLTGMGTTMVLVHAAKDYVYIGNVGDSRVYLFRKPYLWQVTEDHSLVNEQLRAGLIRENQVKAFVGKNVITRSVGYEREVQADVLERPYSKGDLLLLCSDGLSGMVTDEAISLTLNSYSPEPALQQLLKQSLDNGGDDNVTIMLVAL